MPQEIAMARRHNKARKPKQRKRQSKRPSRQPGYDYTIEEWCARRRLSRSMYNKLQTQGLGPRTLRTGRSVRITDKADADWQADRERAAHQ
jgi:hypothetical protein